nr:hypothetical protein [uncultured bacterium]
MTDRELMQQALDALKHLCLYTMAIEGYDREKVQPPINALKKRLAQPEPDRDKLFGVIDLDKDSPLTTEDRKQLRFGLMACLLEEGALAKLGMLITDTKEQLRALKRSLNRSQWRGRYQD